MSNRVLKRNAPTMLMLITLSRFAAPNRYAGPPSCAAFNNPLVVFCEDLEDCDLVESGGVLCKELH